MQFQIPQFIEEEDKIIGPLTIRQFIYVIVAGGISALLFFILITPLFVFFSVLLVGGALAFGFVKIQGRPLSEVVFSGAKYYWQPQTYVWQPEKPSEGKTPSALASFADRATLDKILSGANLKKAWRAIQNNTTPKPKKATQSGRYLLFRKTTGERAGARRVDYSA